MSRPRMAFRLPAGAANRALGLLVGRLGLPVAGVWMLHTRGRRTGRVHAVPVIPVRTGGALHLVAPRGRTDWMLNLLAAGSGTLVRGRTRVAVRAERLRGQDAVPVLAAYIAANRRRNGAFFAVPAPFTRDDVARVAHLHPVVRLTPVPAGRSRGTR